MIKCEAPEQGFAVLADSFYPGWKATVDGRRVPILRANGLFRAVAVTPGIHEIVFRYRPAGFYTGMAISLAFLAVSVFAAFARFTRV
jgi:uncharacterized membrane protein YfhO